MRQNPDNTELLKVRRGRAARSMPPPSLTCALARPLAAAAAVAAQVLLLLLEKISRNDVFKEMVAAEGGIQIIIEYGIFRHFAVKDIVMRCLSTMANLAFNSDANIARIMALDGVKAVELAMQTCA